MPSRRFAMCGFLFLLVKKLCHVHAETIHDRIENPLAVDYHDLQDSADYSRPPGTIPHSYSADYLRRLGEG